MTDEYCEKIVVLAKMIERIANELSYATVTTQAFNVSLPSIREAARISRQSVNIIEELKKKFCTENEE